MEVSKVKARYVRLDRWLKGLMPTNVGGEKITEQERESSTRSLGKQLPTMYVCKSHKWGGFKRGGFPDLDLSFLFLSFLGLSRFSGIIPICSGMVRGFSRFVPFLFLSLLRAPTRNSPERVHDTIWTFPEKMGNPPVWKLPGLASLEKAKEKVKQKVPTRHKTPSNYFKPYSVA